MLIVRATKKLLDRIGPPSLGEDEQSTTLLGQWYATALFWKPQVALFVNEPTLLSVLMPLAPAATLLARFPQQVATVLAAHGTPEATISAELQQMRDHRLAKTANRSVVGIMNDFTHRCADAEDERAHGTLGPDLPARAPRSHLDLEPTPPAVRAAGVRRFLQHPPHPPQLERRTATVGPRSAHRTKPT
jgi:hypothetical protein